MCALALFKIHLSPEQNKIIAGGKKKKIKQPVLYHRCKRLSCYVNILGKKKRYLSPECDTEPDGKIFSFDSYTIISHLFHFV